MPEETKSTEEARAAEPSPPRSGEPVTIGSIASGTLRSLKSWYQSKQREKSGREAPEAKDVTKKKDTLVQRVLFMLLVLIVIWVFPHVYKAITPEMLPHRNTEIVYQGMRIGGRDFVLEVANTDIKRVYGLNDRLGIFPRSGMIWYFKELNKPSLSNKAVPFPILCIGLDENLQVVESAHLDLGQQYKFQKMILVMMQVSPEDVRGLILTPGTRCLEFKLGSIDLHAFVRDGAGWRCAASLLPPAQTQPTSE